MAINNIEKLKQSNLMKEQVDVEIINEMASWWNDSFKETDNCSFMKQVQ